MKKKLDQGKVIARGEPGFDEAVKSTSFNVHDSGRRPDYICQANAIEDVQDAVKLAVSKNLRVSMCSGGHSWSQNHIREGGVLIDLSRLNGVDIDAASKTAIIGPAVLGGDFDALLAKENLLFPVAHAYTVGMGGFLLQGGFGWNSRMVGVACESVIGIDVVLADGRLVHASETENSDLLWAARGSGAGFFGVVVRFHLRLYDRPKYTGVKIQVFRIAHLEAVLAWADSIKSELSPKIELGVVINRKAVGIFSHGLEVVACVLADSKREARELLKIIDKGPLRKDASFTFPLVGTSLGLIMKTGENSLMKTNCQWFTDNSWLNSPIGPALPAIREIVDAQPEAPSHVYWQVWNPLNPRIDMAFSMEGDSYFAIYGSFKAGRDPTDAGKDWSTEGARALEPFGPGIQLGDENLARRAAKFMASENFEKLKGIRSKYDPDSRFYGYGHEN